VSGVQKLATEPERDSREVEGFLALGNTD